MERHGTRLDIKLPVNDTTLTVPVVNPIGKNARIQAAKTDMISRWLQPCCFHHATIATTCAVTDLRQAEADPSRQMTAWRNNDWTFNCFIQSQKLLDIQVQVPTRYQPQTRYQPVFLALRRIRDTKNSPVPGAGP